MAWSYRNDRSDESYHEPGVHLVEGEKLPHTPTSAQDAKEMLDPKLKDKRLKDEEAFKEAQAKQAEAEAKSAAKASAPAEEHKAAAHKR